MMSRDDVCLSSMREVPCVACGAFSSDNCISALCSKCCTGCVVYCHEHHNHRPFIQVSKSGANFALSASFSSAGDLDGNEVTAVPQGGSTAMTNAVFRVTEAAVALSSARSAWTLMFNGGQMERKFTNHHRSSVKRFRISFFVASVLSFIVAVTSFWTDAENIEVIGLWWGIFGTVCGMFLLLMICWKLLKPHLHFLTLGVVAGVCAMLVIAHLIPAVGDTHPTSFGLMLTGLLVAMRPKFFHGVQYVLVACISYVAYYQKFKVKAWTRWNIAGRVIEVTAITLTGLFALYNSERYLRELFVSLKQLNREKRRAKDERQRATELLKNVLPPKIVECIQQQRLPLGAFSAFYPQCSVLQSDIVSFTTFSSTRDAETVIRSLNSMFSKFDNVCATLGLEKVKTIGDAYVCVGGIPCSDPYHAEKIADMGLSMIQCVLDVNSEELGSNVRIRVGMASGPAAAGIVGRLKACYDITGEALEHAELMEQTGRPGCVQCTADVYNNLSVGDRYLFDLSSESGTKRYFIVGRRWARTNYTGQEEGQIPISPDREPGVEDALLQTPAEQKELDIAGKWASYSGKRNPFTLRFTMREAEEEFGRFMRRLATQEQFVYTAAMGVLAFVLLPLMLCLNFPHDVGSGFMIYMYVIGGAHVLVFLLALVRHHRWLDAHLMAKAEPPAIKEHHDPESPSSFVIPSADSSVVVKRVSSVSINPSNPLNKISRGRGSRGSRGSVVAAHSFTMTGVSAEGQGPSGGHYGCSRRVIMLFLHFSWLVFSTGAAVAIPTTALVIHAEESQMGGLLLFLLVPVYIYVTSFIGVPGLVKQAIILLIMLFEIIVWLVSAAAATNNWSFSIVETGSDIVMVVAASLLCCVSLYSLEDALRVVYMNEKHVTAQKTQIEHQIVMGERLLHNVLPASVVRRLHEDPNTIIVDSIPQASVLFVYLHGVDMMDLGAYEGLRAMNAFLAVLDNLCSRYGAEKIKTSPYLVVCGCPEPRPDHASVLVRLALKIMAAIEEYVAGTVVVPGMQKEIKIKIGVHTGRVGAGILGKTKFVYDVFGDTVNTASRLTSSAEWGRIQVSEETRNLVKDVADFEYRGVTELKGKGAMKTYYVRGLVTTMATAGGMSPQSSIRGPVGLHGIGLEDDNLSLGMGRGTSSAMVISTPPSVRPPANANFGDGMPGREPSNGNLVLGGSMSEGQGYVRKATTQSHVPVVQAQPSPQAQVPGVI